MKLVRRPQFLEDVTQAYAYLTDRSPRAADRPLDEIESAIDRLVAMPESGAPRDDLLRGLRSFRIR